MIEILEGDVSTFVPTNVISITDGQILLKPELFYAGNRPAMDVGASVSRVGSDAQTKAVKAVARSIKGDISRYNEVKAFAQFGTSDLDQATRDLLNRGEKLMEILKQGQYKPQSLEDETVALMAIDHVLEMPTSDLQRFEEELLVHMRDRHADLLKTIHDSRELSDETRAAVAEAIEEFKRSFTTSAA